MCVGSKASLGRWKEERLDSVDMQTLLCSPFCISTLGTLALIDLNRLEASCKALRQALHSESALHVWAAAAQIVGRRSRILLPLHILAAMRISSLKSLICQSQLARGSLDCSPVAIVDRVELRAIARICSETALAVYGGQHSRIIVTRFFFDEEDLELAARASEEELFCFSSEASFFWSSSGQSTGSKLTASLGVRKGSNVLEISSPVKSSKQALSLNADLHLVSPDWPKALSATGIKSKVNSICSRFSISGLDLTNQRMRNILACADGVFCILVLSSGSNTAVPPVLPQATDAASSKISSLNALALELPNNRPLRPAMRGTV
jgi:hypothetical protein|mmetsp:Transcript_49849/g.77886  ORF Transcript_49849/g.77886 Transcript_49849/m.77886 type:complete len:323 (-) Transcript_49849:136-1104(-)